jgi:tRNA-binding EMAP/Myf-like protein
MKNYLLLFVFYAFFSCAFAQPLESWDEHKVIVHRDKQVSEIMHMDAIFDERWDMLPQMDYWKLVMQLSPDSCVVSQGPDKKIRKIMPSNLWKTYTDEQKDKAKELLKVELNIKPDELLTVVVGKSNFYLFDVVYPSLTRGVAAFEKNKVDPWYAQAILLIESPGQLKKSTTGAYGPFQLMPEVARHQGLIVTDWKDERKDFDRSAYGAARLISRICIPEAKRMLNKHGISYAENDLWFRLFVMHIYHAGAGNVRAVLDKIAPKKGGKELILAMWQTKAASFGNSSQNYSQVALAAQLILHELIYTKCDEIYHCK